MISRLYLEVVQALDARRRALGWTCAKLDDMAGAQDGYWAKCLHADTPSGRQAGWAMLQLYTDALFPGGATLALLPAQGSARMTVQPRPRKDQTRLDLPDDVLFAPTRQPMPALGKPANGNAQQLALDVTVDTTPGRYRAALAEARRHGPKRPYRRGGVAA